MRLVRTARWLCVGAAALVSLAVAVSGCSSGGAPTQPQGGGGTIIGRVAGFVGAVETPIGGQVVAVAQNLPLRGTSDGQTGVFTISGVTGTVDLVVNPDANGQTQDIGYGLPLNPAVLTNHTVADGQTVDVGTILLGVWPPDSPY